MNTWYAVANSKQWLNAVIFQGHRLLDQNSKAIGIMKKTPNSMVAFQDAMEIERMEQYFFLIAVNKAREWLIEGGTIITELEPLASDFDKSVPFVKEVRNMREHEIEYLKNNGYAQDKFVRSVGPPGTVAADASSTIVNEGAYLIGGRLNVKNAISAANEIYPKVKEILYSLPQEVDE